MMAHRRGKNIRVERMTLSIQQCPLPLQLQTGQLGLKKNNTIRCTLTKQGQRFLTKLSTTDTNTQNLICKFVKSSSKFVLLSTLTHLLSPTTTHHHISSLALPVS